MRSAVHSHLQLLQHLGLLAAPPLDAPRDERGTGEASLHLMKREEVEPGGGEAGSIAAAAERRSGDADEDDHRCLSELDLRLLPSLLLSVSCVFLFPVYSAFVLFVFISPWFLQFTKLTLHLVLNFFS
jgi:hypothetical protein